MTAHQVPTEAPGTEPVRLYELSGDSHVVQVPALRPRVAAILSEGRLYVRDPGRDRYIAGECLEVIGGKATKRTVFSAAGDYIAGPGPAEALNEETRKGILGEKGPVPEALPPAESAEDALADVKRRGGLPALPPSQPTEARHPSLPAKGTAEDALKHKAGKGAKKK